MVAHHVHHARRLVLEQRDAAAHLRGLRPEGVHVMRHLMEHGRARLHSGEHLRHLLADHRLLHQSVAKDLTLHGPLEDLLGAKSRAHDAHHSNHPTLMVEVGHDDLEATTLLTEEVLLRDNGAFICNVGCACSARVLRFDRGALDSIALRHKHHGDTLRSWPTSPHGSDEPLRIHAPRDPLLGSRDDVVLAAGIENGLRPDGGNVASCKGLADGEDAGLVASEQRRDGQFLHPGCPVLEDHGHADGAGPVKAVLPARTHRSAPLLLHHQLVEVIKFLRLHQAPHETFRGHLQVLSWPLHHGNDAHVAKELPEILAGYSASCLALQGVLQGLLGEELPHGFPESNVRLLEVRRAEALQVSRLSIRRLADFAKGFSRRCPGRASVLQATLLQPSVLVQNL
mmetsp:Transcript_25153/g.55727  ORF Transcript_25153/g.55727 Transcript_25153/m.55727 type:complete len:398 (+) Transcript_25153:332-1525(+)